METKIPMMIKQKLGITMLKYHWIFMKLVITMLKQMECFIHWIFMKCDVDVHYMKNGMGVLLWKIFLEFVKCVDWIMDKYHLNYEELNGLIFKNND